MIIKEKPKKGTSKFAKCGDIVVVDDMGIRRDYYLILPWGDKALLYNVRTLTIWNKDGIKTTESGVPLENLVDDLELGGRCVVEILSKDEYKLILDMNI